MKGFQLFELLIVMAIVSILMVLSVPSFHTMWQRHVFRLRYQQLWHMLTLARQQAILSRDHVLICGSRNQKTCDGDWRLGCIIKSSRSQLHHHLHWQSLPQFQVSWRGNHRYRAGIQFNALGETGGQQGRFVLQLGHHIRKEMILSLSGRLRE